MSNYLETDVNNSHADSLNYPMESLPPGEN